MHINVLEFVSIIYVIILNNLFFFSALIIFYKASASFW